MLFFFQPPAAQRTGGLELAVSSLRTELVSNGFIVRDEAEFGADVATKNVLVHFHGLWQPRFLKASRYCRARNIPYIVSPHGMLEPWAWKHKRWKKLPYFLLFERRHLAGASRLLATSEMEAANLRKFFPRSSCAVIPLALPESRQPDYVAARKALAWPDGERVLLFLSRIHPKKGLHLLLEALESLDDSLTKTFRLVVIGGGEASYVKFTRLKAERLRSKLSAVDWLGEIWGDVKWRYLQGADLFCLPSFSENFGLAVLEALQTGTRAIVTNTCPWNFLSEWQAGFVVEPTAESVRSGLKAFATAPGWTEDARNALAARVREKFGWQTVGPMYLDLYRSVVKPASEGRPAPSFHAG